MDALLNHPIFLVVFAMAMAGGFILVSLIKFGAKWFGNGTADIRYLKEDLDEIKNELRLIKEFQVNCRLGIQNNFISRQEFDEWKKGRQDIWNRLNHHSHVDGKVVIGGGK